MEKLATNYNVKEVKHDIIIEILTHKSSENRKKKSLTFRKAVKE